MCNMDCFNCPKSDCDMDGVTLGEKYEQDKRDKQAELERADEKIKRRREIQRKYQKTEKGKAKSKRAQQKAIASGKNAEYCRAYYYRQKQKKLMELMQGGTE